jgi:hypothetical protein
MKIRADTNDENKVPGIGDVFVVTRTEKVAAFYIVELEKEIENMVEIEKKETLGDLVKKTNQELRDHEEMVIRAHVYSILEKLDRHDVIETIQRSLVEMDKDGCDNFFKVKEYVHTLHDVIMLSR